MTTPNLKLMHAYDNEDVFAAKLASAENLVSRLSGAMFGWQMGRNVQADIQTQHAKAQELNNQFRQIEYGNMGQVEDTMRYTPVPDSAMERLASIAYGAGSDLAKLGGIGDFATGITKTLGSAKWKLPAAAAALGAGALAAKGAKSGMNYMNQEARPANWRSGGVDSNQLSYGVNQYGQPQSGSSFQG